MNSKTETYIGFAIKKGSAVFGVDAIARCSADAGARRRKKVFLLLATESLSDNSLKVLESTAEKLSCKLFKIPDYELLKMRNCKAIAICDKQLADAICNSAFGGKNG